MLRTMVKLAGSVATLVQETTLGPVVVQPVAFVGPVMEYAKAELANATMAKKVRMLKWGLKMCSEPKTF